MVILFMGVIICGCSSTYYGRHITAKVKQEPLEEFKVENYVVLAFDNKKTIGAEGWLWEFWVYHHNKLYYKYFLNARVVAGTRNYYLVEEIPGGKPASVASFTAKPNFERVKDRLSANLIEKGAPKIN